jgi:hypothetical protein
MKEIVNGSLRKMSVENNEVVNYQFRSLADPSQQKNSNEVSQFNYTPVNPLIGKTLQLAFSGNIYCINCGRHTKKSFSQGYCYVCFRNLPENDICIMSPEKCHFIWALAVMKAGAKSIAFNLMWCIYQIHRR